MKKQWRHIIGIAGMAVVMLAAVGCQQQQVRPRKAAEPVKGLQRIHFDFDRSAIKPEYQPVLRSNAEWMRQHSNTNVVIEGHCDERGTEEYNLALGDRRAQATRDYLVQLGVSGGRLQTISFGEERPFEAGHDETAWRLNRRAHFVLQR